MTPPNESNDELLALRAEVSRLRIASSHLIVHSRRVLNYIQAGRLNHDGRGFDAYQIGEAVEDLASTLARATSGRWRPIMPGQIRRVWVRHGKIHWWNRLMTRDGFEAALSDLLHLPHNTRPMATRRAVHECKE